MGYPEDLPDLRSCCTPANTRPQESESPASPDTNAANFLRRTYVESRRGSPPYFSCTLAIHGYHLLPIVRGDFLAKLGRFDEARAEFERGSAHAQRTRARVARSRPSVRRLTRVTITGHFSGLMLFPVDDRRRDSLSFT